MAREGAKHLYLLDYSDQVEAFSNSLKQEYPETKVSASEGLRVSYDANG